MALLEDGADLDGEGLLAVVALVHADPGALALQPVDLLGAAAMRADRAVRPQLRLDVVIGGFFAVEPVF